MPLDLNSPADSDLISLGAGEIRSLKSDIQDYLSDQQRRRPVLVWVSATTIDVENNTGTEHQTTIAFPDGEVLSVTENTGSANKYRRFIITSTAEFTSGTEDSGLRSGITEANNTTYAIYAVKSTIDATKFVLAGDTTFPTQANASTLDTRYGANNYVFLGYIRNGDNEGTAGDILAFDQVGNFTRFRNTTASYLPGYRVSTASATEATFAPASNLGSGSAQVPDTVGVFSYCGYLASSTRIAFRVDSTYEIAIPGLTGTDISVMNTAAAGASVAIVASGSTTCSIYVAGFYDRALS